MEGSGLALCLIIVSSHIFVCEGLEACNRRCGSKTVPYPFGFSGGCPNKLNCSVEGNITMEGFRVENISGEGVRITHDFQSCQKQLKDIYAFHEQYALTNRNILLVKDCDWNLDSPSASPNPNPNPNPSSACSFNVSLIPFYLSMNQRQSCNLSEYTCLDTNGRDFIKWKDLSIPNCKPLLTNIVVDTRDSLEVVVDLGNLELGWWINGNCSPQSCSANADCNHLISPNTDEPAFKCSCKPGFVGDGFSHGDGCRKDSSRCNPSRYVSGDCGGSSRVGLLIGGIIAGAAVVVVMVSIYCLVKRSWVRTSRKRGVSANQYPGGALDIPVNVFSYRELERATKGFSEQQRLGNGAYGTVYAGRLRRERAGAGAGTGTGEVAVKRIRHMEKQGIEQAMNEMRVLSSVEHPNVVRLLGCCIENGEAILVYEYMPNGTLAQRLQRKRGAVEGLSWTQRLTVASETASALAHLHSGIDPPIFHRDVKSSNILLDYSFHCKLGDFGLSRFIETESSHISTVPQGTPGYVDPQYHQNFHLSDKSDVYSFGVVLVEIITALKAVDFTRSKSEVNLAALAIDKIGSGCVDDIIDPFLQRELAVAEPCLRRSVHRMAELAFRCLAFDRDARPTMLEVAEELQFIITTRGNGNGNGNGNGTGTTLHAVVFMFPLQGHIIPTFNLAKKLAAKGVVVTLVCTQGCYARITKASNGRDPFADNATSLGLDIRSALVSDGLPVEFDRSLNDHEFTSSLLYHMESHVEEFIGDLQSKGPLISCIIADTYYVWPRRIANKFGIPYVSFWTESVMVYSIYYNWDLLIKNGHHPFTGNEGELINYIPGAPALKLTDLPSYLQESDVSKLDHTYVFEAFQSARTADWIVSNTVDELESRTIEELQLQSGISFFSVGPLLPSSLLEDGAGGKDKDEMGTSMWPESDCTSWLDGKAKRSVIYVSFGSFAHVSKAQIHEMAMGLLHSERPFIWVLRPDIVASDVQDILPEGFLEESKEQGLVVEWLSQLDVLSHSSVGGFLTHCGWNSIMESLWLGVPMLGFPLLTDQYTNCRLIVEEWGVAMRLGVCSRSKNNMRSNLVEREEITASIQKFMDLDGEEGTKIRDKVENARAVMKKTVTNGGSSQKNLDLFVEDLKLRNPLI